MLFVTHKWKEGYYYDYYFKENAPKHDVDKLIHKFEGMNLQVTMIQGDNYNVFGLVGDTSIVDEKALWQTPLYITYNVLPSLIN